MLDRAQVLELEPALQGAAAKIAGGDLIARPTRAATAHKFTRGLASVCVAHGRGDPHRNTTITAIEARRAMR